MARRIVASLAIFQPDARAAARLSAALSGEHCVRVHTSWESLEGALTAESVHGCLVDADHPDRASSFREMARIRRLHGHLGIVAIAGRGHSSEYYDLGGLGIDGVVLESANPTTVRAVVEKALAMSRGRAICSELATHLPPPGPAAVAWAVSNAGPDGTAARLAEALGCTRGSLRRTLQEAGLPTPKRLLLWGRLLLAGARLGQDGRAVEEVAFSLGYSTANSLSRAMKRHTGFTPRQVAQGGGMNRVRAALFPRSERSLGARAFRSLIVFALLALQAGCAARAGGTPIGIRDEIDGVLDAPPLDQVHFGVFAVDRETGGTIYSRNHRRKFVPASNQKILTTAAAISLLGPEYRYRTEVWAAGIRNGALLDGDLVVVATGDPSLSGRYWASGEMALAALADSIRAAGIARVTGSLYVDVSSWDSTTVGPTWEVADLAEAYSSTGGAFVIDEGELRLIAEGGPAVGSPARVVWSPLGTTDYVRSRLETSAPDSLTKVEASYLPESRQLVLDGTVAYGQVDTLAFAIRDPVRQAVAAFERALGEAGVVIENGPEVSWSAGARAGRGCSAGAVRTCSSATFVTSVQSPPLSELIAGILGPSQNWMAEQLVRTLGAEFGELGSWSEGLTVVEGFLTGRVGLDTLDTSSRDGSGLSRYNLITPMALVRVLQHALESPAGELYRTAMARPAQPESTLEERLLDLEGRVFGKTGSMSNVNSLSGYLVRSDGREVIFSILSNGSGLPEALLTGAIDEVVRVLAR